MFLFIRHYKQDADALTESAAYNVWEHVNLFSASLYESTQGFGVSRMRWTRRRYLRTGAYLLSFPRTGWRELSRKTSN
jgi:hypothetical protein